MMSILRINVTTRTELLQVRARGTMPDLADGEGMEMKGLGAKPYVLRNSGGVYSCSCPAWRKSVNVVCLLALSDQGAPVYDQSHAAQFAALGIPRFACTPDLFPDLMAAAIQRRDLSAWAARNDIVAVRR